LAKFVVQFASPSGKMGQEVLEANSERAAVARIEGSGRTPISVQVAGASGAKRKASRSAGRIRKVKGGKSTRRAVMDFTHQMAAVAESGIPIVAGLKAVGDQTTQVQLKRAIGRMVGRIEGGRTLADAIDAERDCFPEIYAKTLAAGEAAGKVPEVLESLARYQEQEDETRGQIKSAMTYPALVVCSLVLATIILLVFVVPQFATLFTKFGGELPLPTRMLLAVSDVMTNHYLLMIGGAIGLYFLVRHVLSFKVVKTWLDHRLLKLPVFGNLLIGVYMVRFIELLDLLMQAALPITQALRVTRDSMTNEALRTDIRGILHSVEGGHSMTEAFAETKWLTPLVKRMLAIGEKAGRTDQIFTYLRKYYAVQTQRSIKLLSTLVEPVMIVGLAGVVLFFALAIFLPMWKLLKLVGSA
jgi:type II secretory pathway component PulF